MERTQTKVIIYTNDRKLQKGIAREEKQDWEVVGVSHVDPGWGFWKTCCLGCVFLPLALLGRKSVKYQVTYKRTMKS